MSPLSISGKVSIVETNGSVNSLPSATISILTIDRQTVLGSATSSSDGTYEVDVQVPDTAVQIIALFQSDRFHSGYQVVWINGVQAFVDYLMVAW